MTESQAPRRNPHLGTECPPWCDTDHTQKFHEACIGSGGDIGPIWASAVRTRDDSHVSISASLPDVAADWPHLTLGLREAEHLAVIAGLLADATPEDHRKLAAAIRQAAADITEAGQ